MDMWNIWLIGDSSSRTCRCADLLNEWDFQRILTPSDIPWPWYTLVFYLNFLCLVELTWCAPECRLHELLSAPGPGISRLSSRWHLLTCCMRAWFSESIVNTANFKNRQVSYPTKNAALCICCWVAFLNTAVANSVILFVLYRAKACSASVIYTRGFQSLK